MVEWWRCDAASVEVRRGAGIPGATRRRWRCEFRSAVVQNRQSFCVGEQNSSARPVVTENLSETCCFFYVEVDKGPPRAKRKHLKPRPPLRASNPSCPDITTDRKAWMRDSQASTDLRMHCGEAVLLSSVQSDLYLRSSLPLLKLDCASRNREQHTLRRFRQFNPQGCPRRRIATLAH